MSYEKRVAVLKQINKGFSADGGALSGAVYLERFGRELTVKVQAAGLAALKEGRYALVLSVGNTNFCLALGRGEALKISLRTRRKRLRSAAAEVRKRAKRSF